MTHRGFSFKLYPTEAQEHQFRQFAGVCRLVYNLALEQRSNWWRQYKARTGKSINCVSQAAELTALRAGFDFVREVPCDPQQQALRDLDRAFANFFAGRAGYPTRRRRGMNDSFRFPGSRAPSVERFNAKWSGVRIPKIGLVKFRQTRPIEGKLLNATVSRTPGGGWSISFACEIEDRAPLGLVDSVGIDRGVAHTLALSDGMFMDQPIAQLAKLDKRMRAVQRVVARRKKGSRRREKAKARVAALSAQRARIRKDWNHKASTTIADKFGVVVIEALKTKNMTASARGSIEAPGKNVAQKAGINRAILNQGWFQFETFLAYKLEANGGYLFKVSPAYTSQTCSTCGHIDKRSRESQASFVCTSCGYEAHADTNAALNILRRNTAVGEGQTTGPMNRELPRVA